MITILPRQTILFLLLLLAQIILNRTGIDVLLGIYPFIYLLFILSLPFETPGWVLLLAAFASGLMVDLFSNTFGVHTSASVFIAFMRPFVLSLIAPREGYENGTFPFLSYYGFRWYLRYALTLIILHHLWYFFLEAFGFSFFYLIMARILLNSIYTLVAILLSQYLFFRR